MKTKIFTLMIVALLAANSLSGQTSERLTASKSQIKFFSSTPVEDIEAVNLSATGTLNKQTGEIFFSVPMQGFQFEKALMQKHFNNSDFLDTKKFPEAMYKGKITNIDKIDFTKDGTYPADVAGSMTLKGATKEINEKGAITVKSGVATANSKFMLTLADFGITFQKGKPSTNIAKEVEVTIVAEYK